MFKLALLTAQLIIPVQQRLPPTPPLLPLQPPKWTYVDPQGGTVTVTRQPGGGVTVTDSHGRTTIITEDGVIIRLPPPQSRH
jgi:hypothetical protein